VVAGKKRRKKISGNRRQNKARKEKVGLGGFVYWRRKPQGKASRALTGGKTRE